MKSLLSQLLIFCCVVRAAAEPSDSLSQQQPMVRTGVMSGQSMEAARKVPGSNNATFGPVPEEDQLFRVEFLEIAPTPVPDDGRYFFVLLRGRILSDKAVTPDDLAAARLSITLSVVLEDGTHEEPTMYTVPLRTTAFNNMAHLSIRDAEGKHVACLTGKGDNDILTDFMIPGMFVQPGTWTFGVESSLPDGRWLFSMQLTQWLNGGLK